MAENNIQSNTLSYAAVAANNNPVGEATMSQEEFPPSDARNYRLETVVLDRPYTATFGSRDGQIPIDVIVKYFEQIKILHDIKCINNISKNDRETVLEVTFRDFASDFAEKINKTKLRHQDLSFEQLDTRSLKDVKIQPLTRVMIYEAPYELENQHIFNKLRTYGEVADQTIFMHKYKNTGILNGVRSLAFTKINKPVPTTMFVKGNLIKLRHNGQDRTPFCTKCKTKGHYRLDCPQLNNLIWTEPAMDWAQAVEEAETIHPQSGEQLETGNSAHPLGGDQQVTLETTHPQGEQQQQQSKKTENTTSPGGRQQKQKNTKTVNKTAKSKAPQENTQVTNQNQESTDLNSQLSHPDQEWQEIKYKNKSVKRHNNSNTAGLTQIMGEIFTQEEGSKSAVKRKNRTRVRSGTKTLKTEIEYNKYSSESDSTVDASDERSSESSSDETTITESAEN